MIYTDKIHIVADSLEELHAFAKSIGIKRHWFEGLKKGHPHYDIPKYLYNDVLTHAKVIDSKSLLDLSKRLLLSNLPGIDNSKVISSYPILIKEMI